MFENEEDIRSFVANEPSMMMVLREAERENLPDWWIGAGFLRNAVWDRIEGNRLQMPRDIDLVYFDPTDDSPERDWRIEMSMGERAPGIPWEVRNQARMHVVDGAPPYHSCAEGIAHWTETATTIGVRLETNNLVFLYCQGSDDLLNLILRPTVYRDYSLGMGRVLERARQKQWFRRWPDLTVRIG